MKSPSVKPRKSGWYRFLKTIPLLLVVGVPLSDVLWGLWAEHRLNHKLADLHTAGEPVAPEQLKFDSVPDAQNASLDYRVTGDAINDGTPDWGVFYKSTGKEYRSPLTKAETKTVHAIVSANAAVLKQVAAARGKSAGGWHDSFSHPAAPAMSDLTGVRTLCTVLKFAAMDAHAQGDDMIALQRLGDALSVADASEQRPTLIAHLVAVGVTSLSSEAVSELSPQLHVGSHGLSRDAVSTLLGRLQDERAMNDGVKLSWRTERMVGLTGLTDLVNGKIPAPSPKGLAASSYSTSTRVFGFLFKPVLLNDARLYAEHLQGLITASSAPDWPAAQRQIPTALPAMVNAHPMYHIFISLLLPSLDKAGRADYESKTVRRLAVVALAVRLYAADHGDQLPASPGDLVPAYLSAIPIDPMSGSPLKYKSDPPRVYSVGADGVDDGGVPVDPYGDRYHREHGDVVVYLVTQPGK